jgi:hypothetical protein
MQNVSFALVLASFCAAAAATWYLHRANATDTSPTWARGPNPFEPVVSEMAQMGCIVGLTEGLYEAARLNKLAIKWTGTSVLLSALATVVGRF